MKENVVKSKSFAFAVRMVNLFKYLSDDMNMYCRSNCFVREKTAIGALVREAEQAESKADFILN